MKMRVDDWHDLIFGFLLSIAGIVLSITIVMFSLNTFHIVGLPIIFVAVFSVPAFSLMTLLGIFIVLKNIETENIEQG